MFSIQKLLCFEKLLKTLEEVRLNKSHVYNIGKFVAIILVVFAHCSRMYTGLGVVTPVRSSGFLGHLTEYIYSFHMPLFFMISGCIFAYCIEHGKYHDRKEFIKKRVCRLLVPYLIFGLFYVAPVMIFFHFTSDNYFSYIIHGILLSLDSRHLWFILALFWINIIAIMTKSLYNKHQTFILLLINSLILCLVSKYFPFEFRLQSAAFYQFFFFLGMAFNKYYDWLEEKLPLKPLFSIFFGAFLILQFYLNPSSLKIIDAVLGSLMILLFSMTFGKQDLPSFINHIAKNSYGIYLFHPMIIYILFHYTYRLNISPFILCFSIFVISFILSYLLTLIVRKIKIGFIIGE